MEAPSENDAQQMLAAALSIAAPSSSPASAAHRVFLARAVISGPLGGDPSEPAVMEFLQRLAALEHGHALVAAAPGGGCSAPQRRRATAPTRGTACSC